MKFEVSSGENYQKTLQVEISTDEMALACKLAGKRISQKVNIPGFRKGKAPYNIVENFVGVQTVLDEAADELVPKACADGMKENNLEAVDKPELEVIQLQKDKPFIFKATMTVMPEVTLGQYKGLELTKTVYEVTDAEIDSEIEKQRVRLTKLEDAVEGFAAEKNSTVTIDFTGYHDGTAFPGGKAEDYPLELGSGSFVPGFEDQLIGCKVGEEKRVKVTFPEKYHDEKLAGQPVEFDVTIKGIKVKVLPDLDDAFVQEVSETSDTMEQYRVEVKEKLLEKNRLEAEDACHAEAIKQIVANATLDVPPMMIEQRIDALIENLDQRLKSQGLSVDKFIEFNGGDMDSFRENYRVQADQGVKMDLVLGTVADEEKIEVSKEEIEEHVTTMADNYGQPVEVIQDYLVKSGQIYTLIDGMRMQKALDLIYQSAVITEEITDRPEPQAAVDTEVIADATEEAGEIVDAD